MVICTAARWFRFHRLETGVREPQVQDLAQAHLSRWWSIRYSCDSSMWPWVSSLRARVEARSWPNCCSTTTPGVRGQAGLGQALDHGTEQERRDLRVEDRGLRLPDRGRQPLEGGRVGEVAREVRQPPGEAVEDRLVHGLTGGLDRLAGMLAEVVDRPVVDRHPDDGTARQAAALQPVQGAERHHLREIPADTESNEHIRGLGGGHRRDSLVEVHAVAR
jgi:hypothetical protein